MYTYKKTPFNIDILILKKADVRYLGEVTSLNIFESSTQNFDPHGLFSTEIFGTIGTSERNERFGYIDLHTEVFHPLVFEHISKLKSLYKEIAYGRKYAIFDKKLKDFVASDIERGRTGYSFLLEYIDSVKFSDNDSDQRAYRIKLLKMFNNEESMMKYWLVLPAGLRDYTVSEDGKPSEDEVNDIYRKLMNTTALLKNTKIDKDQLHLIDNIRIKIQIVLEELYQHYKTLLDGKNKFIQGKWAKRAISNGTRNVITPVIYQNNDVDDPNKLTMDDTIVGIYQYVRGIAPVTMNKIHSKFVSRVLNPDSNSALLVNPKSMKSELKEISIKKRDEWLSLEGLDKIIHTLSQVDRRAEPVIIDGWYMFLVYDNGKEIEVIYNTDNMDEEYDKKYIRPMTYVELLYLSIYDVRGKYPALLTRYPVTGLGSIYPTKLYVKTTVTGRAVTLIENGNRKTVIEYPILTEPFVSSMSPSSNHIGKLGADLTIK